MKTSEVVDLAVAGLIMLPLVVGSAVATVWLPYAFLVDRPEGWPLAVGLIFGVAAPGFMALLAWTLARGYLDAIRIKRRDVAIRRGMSSGAHSGVHPKRY